MNEGKAKVIGEVLKQQGMFKAARISNNSGLSRQLVFAHLSKLVNEGYLEKDGMYYGVVARQDLVDALVQTSENNVTGLLPDTFELDPKKVNRVVESSIRFRAAKVPGSERFKNAVLQEIDQNILLLKGLRRYLNSKTVSEYKALKTIEREFDEHWRRIKNFTEINREDFYSFIDKKLSDEEKAVE